MVDHPRSCCRPSPVKSAQDSAMCQSCCLIASGFRNILKRKVTGPGPQWCECWFIKPIICRYIMIHLPMCSMYGIFTYICPNNHPNVGKYTINGAYGLRFLGWTTKFLYQCWVLPSLMTRWPRWSASPKKPVAVLCFGRAVGRPVRSFSTESEIHETNPYNIYNVRPPR